MNQKNPMHGAIEEPLQGLARMAWDQAESLCDPQHGCMGYHRAWSLVRLLSLDGALPGASAFFIEEIARRITGGARRILISGSADTGLLAVVAQAIRRAGQLAQIVIVDRCKTPLQQCRDYADRLGLPVEFHECDVRELQIDPVDVVIAHSFLLFFPEPDRQQVIDSWARVTQEGATVLLFSPISPDEHTLRCALTVMPSPRGPPLWQLPQWGGDGMRRSAQSCSQTSRAFGTNPPASAKCPTPQRITCGAVLSGRAFVCCRSRLQCRSLPPTGHWVLTPP